MSCILIDSLAALNFTHSHSCLLIFTHFHSYTQPARSQHSNTRDTTIRRAGEQQRTTIARAVANQPDILLLDEPTGDLDTKNSESVMKMLLDLNRDERTRVEFLHGSMRILLSIVCFSLGITQV